MSTNVLYIHISYLLICTAALPHHQLTVSWHNRPGILNAGLLGSGQGRNLCLGTVQGNCAKCECNLHLTVAIKFITKELTPFIQSNCKPLQATYWYLGHCNNNSIVIALNSQKYIYLLYYWCHKAQYASWTVTISCFLQKKPKSR